MEDAAPYGVDIVPPIDTQKSAALREPCPACGQDSNAWIGDICLFCKHCRNCRNATGDHRQPWGTTASQITPQGKCQRPKYKG
jgi:hypothetical protein